ncbi:MAG: hypothetical protein D6690_00335 [Nitrospirae bacterium]|nr:MAG: hypothetical protein D6690_00335 [Nitrospirota bacterium]
MKRIRRTWQLLGLTLALLWTVGNVQFGAGAEPGFHRLPISFIVEAPPDLAPIADRIRNLPASRFSHVLEWVSPISSYISHQPIRVILAKSPSPWARTAPQWAAAYALSSQNLIVLFPDRIGHYPYDSLEAVLIHEVTHILIDRVAGTRALPRWFDEGMVMVAARTLGLDDHARLIWAVIAGNPVSFAEVDALFLGDRASAHRGYILANAIVRFYLQQFGARWPQYILTALAQDRLFPAAFAEASGRSLKAVETAFWTSQTSWTRWVPVMASSTTLWIGIILLVVWLLTRQRGRTRAIRQQWRKEDEDGP